MNWNDIKLKQWYELQQVKDLYPEELDQRLAMIGICHGYTFDEMSEVKISDINKMTKELDFFDTPMKVKLVSKWKDIKFIVKLSDLKAGQMIHFMDIASKDIELKLHTVLAILDTTYPKNFAEVEKQILNECPITIVKGLSDFFFRKYNLSLETIREYSLSQLKEMKTNLKTYNRKYQDSQKIGNGLEL